MVKLVGVARRRYHPLVEFRRSRLWGVRGVDHGEGAYSARRTAAALHAPGRFSFASFAKKQSSILLLLFAAAACGSAPDVKTQAPPQTGKVREGTPKEVDIAAARAKGLKRSFEWEEWSQASFERARRERKYILLGGAAEWCHWCHVMDDTTYTDPEVGRILRERFVAIRVDIDARPDIAERYADWGWPATILFSPDAEEIGKYRGYLAAQELVTILSGIERAHVDAVNAAGGSWNDPGRRVPPVEALGWIGARTALDMDEYFDRTEGGWGVRQKAPLGSNISFELVRHAHGDPAALKRAVFSLEKQRALIDPIWGGIYQYSAGATWADPHYEKLMSYQAENIEAYARAFAATKNQAFLADARALERYLATFLRNNEGAFLVSQDADVGGHDKSQPFVDGAIYYGLDDAGRRALGIPRVDPSVYGLENGLAIAALSALHEASPDPSVLDHARKAADLLLRTHVTSDGAVRRPGKVESVRFLADSAAFGRGLARLAEVTGESAYKDAALRISKAMLGDFSDGELGALWASTPDPAAAGVFARREKPFTHNVMAARFLSTLAKITGDKAHAERARRILAAISSPRSLSDRGRMVGEYLLALDESGAFVW